MGPELTGYMLLPKLNETNRKVWVRKQKSNKALFYTWEPECKSFIPSEAEKPFERSSFYSKINAC